jgi:sugar transferase (PEP-CTERM/EpsH1 system associated)
VKQALIVHVVHHFDTGGLENGMVNLFNTLSPDRYRHVVVTLTGYSDFRQRITAQAVEFHALNKRAGHDYGWMLRLWKLLRELKPDLVHTRNLSALEAQFVAFAAGIRRTVHGEHGRDVFDLHGQRRRYTVLRRAAAPLVSRYIAVSRDLADWLQHTVGVSPGKIRQIYNGVDCAKFHPGGERDAARAILPPGFADSDSVVYGSVGRMAEVKDYPTLVRAFIHLHTLDILGARARLVIVGDGIARQTCLDLLAAAGLAHCAWLPGERHDIADILRSFDVFVLPSLNEGISNTVLEAQASALPVVATAVGGNVELVEHGVTGLLVAAGDIEAMAHALLSYLATPAQIVAQGSQARQRVARDFSIPAMAAAYADVYDSLLTNSWRLSRNIDPRQSD